MIYNSSVMFDIYSLEKKLFRNTSIDEQKLPIYLTQKQDRLNKFDNNVKVCLQNEIKSKSYVNNKFGVDYMSDASRVFNFSCTKIIFKDYLENNNTKFCELQVIFNDL